MRNIRQVAVLGAGTMGARIAAHFANAGVSVLLLDLTVDAARKGLDTALKGKPGGFFLPEYATRVTPGSFDADLPKVAGCDWIVEAVTEKLDAAFARRDRFDEHFGDSAGTDQRGLRCRIPAALPGNALF